MPALKEPFMSTVERALCSIALLCACGRGQPKLEPRETAKTASPAPAPVDTPFTTVTNQDASAPPAFGADDGTARPAAREASQDARKLGQRTHVPSPDAAVPHAQRSSIVDHSNALPADLVDEKLSPRQIVDHSAAVLHGSEHEITNVR
jgi:hypothetical protein